MIADGTHSISCSPRRPSSRDVVQSSTANVDYGDFIRVDLPPGRRMVEMEGRRRSCSQQSPCHLIPVGELFQLVTCAEKNCFGIIQSELLSEGQSSSIDEGWDAAKY